MIGIKKCFSSALGEARNVPSNITDPHLSKAFSDAQSLIEEEGVDRVKNDADRDRHGDTSEQIDSAAGYLALAFNALDSVTEDFNDKESQDFLNRACRFFHFAGHGFLNLGNVNRAADAYWRSGVVGSVANETSSLSIRSLARAKICYQDIGITEKSDQMHILEWHARLLASTGVRSILLDLWRVTSLYGVSLRRWIVSIALTLTVFTLLYEGFARSGLLHGADDGWTPLISAFYYAVVTTTTVGYGEIHPIGPFAQIAVVLNIFIGYVLFAIGTTILGRKVLAR